MHKLSLLTKIHKIYRVKINLNVYGYAESDEINRMDHLLKLI